MGTMKEADIIVIEDTGLDTRVMQESVTLADLQKILKMMRLNGTSEIL